VDKALYHGDFGMAERAKAVSGARWSSFSSQQAFSGVLHTYHDFTLETCESARRLDILLPENYAGPDTRFPVIYMNDGNTAFFKGGLAHQTWDIGNTIRILRAAEVLEPVIVVAIHPTNRNREYTHEHWSGPDCCGLEIYSQCVAGIKAFADTFYPTRPARESAMIAGSSHGGLAAFYTGLRNTRSFGLVAALSPSFWVGVDDAEAFPLVRASPQRALRNSNLLATLDSGLRDRTTRPRLYIDWGLVRFGGAHNEFIEERATARSREMAQLLQEEYGYQLGRDLITFEDPNGHHDEQSWGARWPRVLRLFCPK
jgi:predicted alpha/beta superfamily hydrolase